MSNFASRILVAAVGLPLVLGMLWLGGWWVFTLLAVASVVAVHEYVTTARPLRPLAPAVYGGVLLALFGAEEGGVVWLLGGFLATFVLAFVLHAVSSTRAPTTAAVGSTILGAAWIGIGLGFGVCMLQLVERGDERLGDVTSTVGAEASGNLGCAGCHGFRVQGGGRFLNAARERRVDHFQSLRRQFGR